MRLKSSTFETETSDNIVDNITKIRGIYYDTFQVCSLLCLYFYKSKSHNTILFYYLYFYILVYLKDINNFF